MFKVLDRLSLPNNIHCVSIEGDIKFLKIGLKLLDEKGNIFEIESVGMTHFRNMEDLAKYADVVLCGDVENIGTMLCPHFNMPGE